MNDFSEKSDEEKMYYVLYHAFLFFQERKNHLNNILERSDDEEHIKYCNKTIDEHKGALKFIEKWIGNYLNQQARDNELKLE